MNPIEAMAAHKLTVSSVFVPFTKSRRKGEKSPSLNWIVTLHKGGREVWTGDYTAGCGHCPAYNASVRELGGANSLLREEAIRRECETGCAASFSTSGLRPGIGAAILPDACDMMHSLLLDGSAIDYRGFEDWAADFGADTDSRKAYADWQACVDTGLKLRAALGDAALSELRTAFEEY